MAWVLWKTSATKMLAQGYAGGIKEREPSWKTKIVKSKTGWKTFVDKRVRNPKGQARFTYGVVVHGSSSLSTVKRTLHAAKKYKTQLYNRGLLFGRSLEIIKIDNVNNTSNVVFYQDYTNAPSSPAKNPAVKKGKWMKVKAVRVTRAGLVQVMK